MDPSRFDRLTRALAGLTTRRGALAGLLGGVLLPLASLLPGDETDAKTRQRKHSSRRERDRDQNHAPEQHDETKRGNQGPDPAKKKKTCKPPLKSCKISPKSKKTRCVNLATSATNCGGCGKKCAPGQTCKDKVCCAASQRCGAACCPAGQTCQNGACVTPSTECGGASCAGCCDGGTCRGGTSDAQCGKQGAACFACTDGLGCRNGACVCGDDGVCDDGDICCNGGCRNLQSSFADCGTCGTACDNQTSDRCVGGACACGNGAECAAGLRCCNGVCKTVDTDLANCGGCGQVCGTTANRCAGGVCLCGPGGACGSGQTCCNGVCKSLGTDTTNCGVCGNVCNGVTSNQCVGGACKCGNSAACSAGQTCCGGVCKALGTDTANCGTCDHVCDSQRANQCVGGACKCGGSAACGAGQTCCGGVCTTITSDTANCGGCGAVCPGLGQPATNVTCQNSTCTFTCKGENYDMNNNPANGCEVTPAFVGHHTFQTASYVGELSCNDGDRATIRGTLVSDKRIHESPAIEGFNLSTGAAPHWWYLGAVGGIGCQNDPDITFIVNGALTDNCYQLTFQSNKGTWSAVASGGAARIDLDTGSYSDDTPVYFVVEKTCVTSGPESAAYEISFHL